MTINVELDNIISGYNLNSININFERIKTALESAYNKSGVENNQLSADLDVNGNQLINVERVKSNVLEVGGVVINPSELQVVDLGNVGEWADNTEYDINNIVVVDGSAYISKQRHTSSTDSEPATGGEWDTFWSLLVARGEQGPIGATGTGSGDLIATNNLSDVQSVESARTNLSVPSLTQFNTLDGEVLKDSDVGTGANNIVQLDGNGRLPAVDASQVTNLQDVGKVLFKSSIQRRTTTSSPTSLPVTMGGSVQRQVRAIGNRIVVNGNVNWKATTNILENGLTIQLKRSGVVVDSMSLFLVTTNGSDSSFALEYTVPDFQTGVYTVEAITPSSNTTYYAGCFWTLEEVAA